MNPIKLTDETTGNTTVVFPQHIEQIQQNGTGSQIWFISGNYALVRESVSVILSKIPS